MPMICDETTERINIEPFGVQIGVFVNRKQVKFWAENTWPDDSKTQAYWLELWDSSNGVSICEYLDGVAYFALMLKARSHEVVCHEAVHMSGQIMEQRGIPWERSTDEVRAYLSGYIFREACKHIGLKVKE